MLLCFILSPLALCLRCLTSHIAFPLDPTPKQQQQQELDWTPQYGNLEGFADSYQNDFVLKQAAGTLKTDFECDDMVIKVRGGGGWEGKGRRGICLFG